MLIRYSTYFGELDFRILVNSTFVRIKIKNSVTYSYHIWLTAQVLPVLKPQNTYRCKVYHSAWSIVRESILAPFLPIAGSVKASVYRMSDCFQNYSAHHSRNLNSSVSASKFSGEKYVLLKRTWTRSRRRGCPCAPQWRSSSSPTWRSFNQPSLIVVLTQISAVKKTKWTVNLP